MSESTPNRESDSPANRSAEAPEKRFRVSRNRGRARHRIRYIESGGAAEQSGQCPLCTGEMNEQS